MKKYAYFATSALSALEPSRFLLGMRKDWHETIRSLDVIRCLAGNQLRMRYHDSFLGFLWSLLNPLLMLGILSLVFSQVLKFPMPHFSLYLFTGIIPWSLFQTGVQACGATLVNNQALIRKVHVNKLIFPISEVAVALMNMVFSFLALGTLVLVVCPIVYWQVWLILPAVALMALFTLGCGLIAMTLVTYFRDVNHIITALLQVLYFMTPLFYTKEALGKYSWVAELNPLSNFISLFRCAMYDGTWPSAGVWCDCGLCCLTSLIIGYALFKWREHDFIFRL